MLSKQGNKAFFTRIAVFVWAVMIFVFSVMPYGPAVPLGIGYVDKTGHFFVYAVLAVLTFRAARGIRNFSFLKNALIM